MSEPYNYAKRYQHSELLYKILPVVYRERDSQQHLKKFLNGSGVLLDQLQATLLQRYADIFPDEDAALDIKSQPWLLPYIADLLDVSLVSPTEDGQRAEIAHAISWRKGKGTLRVVKDIAEKIGGLEVVLHEGWKTVITTARVTGSAMPLNAQPSGCAGTVALSCVNQTLPGTVDFRKPDWQQGHKHPRRVLLYSARHPGFFVETMPERLFDWSDTLIDLEDFRQFVSIEQFEQQIVFRNKSLDEDDFQPLIINKRVKLEQVSSGTGPVNPVIWRFEGIIFRDTIEVDSGRLELERCAVEVVEVHSSDLELTVITADNCLFKKVRAAKGLVQLQYCTVLQTTIAEKLQASDCIFNGLIRKDLNTDSLPGKGCIRYSAILAEQSCGQLTFYRHYKLPAVFNSEQYAQPGCAVLHPSTAEQISSGAEDGAEMGAYHHLFLAARRAAVVKKLSSFLPIGMQAVVIPVSDKDYTNLSNKQAL